MKKSRPFALGAMCLVGAALSFVALYFFRNFFILRIVGGLFIITGASSVFFMHFLATSGKLEDDVKPWLRRKFSKWDR